MAVSYDLFIEPDVHDARAALSGNMRQRIRRVFDSLVATPRPPESRALDTADLDVPNAVELRRVRIERWRIIYAINEREQWVWVLALRRRPPYDYADLPDLVAKLSDS